MCEADALGIHDGDEVDPRLCHHFLRPFLQSCGRRTVAGERGTHVGGVGERLRHRLGHPLGLGPPCPLPFEEQKSGGEEGHHGHGHHQRDEHQ